MVISAQEWAIFLGMVFIAVFLLASSFITPVFGENRQVRKRLGRRVQALYGGGQSAVALLRADQLGERSGLERRMGGLPGMERLALLAAQAGLRVRPERVVLIALLAAAGAGLLVMLLRLPLLLAPLAALAAGAAPFLFVLVRRQQRFARFEEQLPDAIGVMSRALKAGHPFSDALRLVGEEMTDPVAGEFRTTFAELNYGGDLRRAFGHLLERMPSVTVLALVTAVLVQRETGGNLAEILDRLAETIRARFRFQRRVRTLSAEARMSAWILMAVPFVLVGALSVTNPDYIPMLTKDPRGIKLIGGAFGLMLLGMLWMRRIIRVEV